MATTWTFTEVVDPDVGRARFVDEKGRRGVRGILSAGGAAGAQTYTTGGDNLPVVHFKEIRDLKVLTRLPDAVRAIPTASVTISVASPNFVAAAGTGGFTAADVGKVVVGTNIPANTHIREIISADEVRLSANATGSAGGTSYFIGGDDASTPRPWRNPQNVRPTLIPGVPGKVRLHAGATGAEAASALDVTGSAFLVEIVGK